MLSRTKPAIDNSVKIHEQDSQAEKKKTPKLDTFIERRDYTGAITLLEFVKSSGKFDIDMRMWLGYAYFHLGDYKKAMECYLFIAKDSNADPKTHLYLACCYFYLGMYKEADDEAQKGPASKLQNRLLFHLSHKFNDEKRLMGYHQNLQDVIEDQLTLASMHYLRGHYQEAIDIYKRLLIDNKDFLAINVYIAMCYYKLDYFDVSQDMLSVYLQSFPDSVIAINLKGCNHFKLYNGKAAENELKTLEESTHPNFKFAEDLIKHNMVVFKSGEGSLQIFPALIDVVPEARLNLAIYYLNNDETMAAYNLMKNVEPSTPNEYILKAIVNVTLGQEQDSRDLLKTAQQYFQLVGGSASECDTIPGRQCMCSCFFIMKQFEDVVIYLTSIKGYLFNNDAFNLNFAQAKVATKSYQEAEEALMMIQNEKFKNEYTYLSHLVKCYIMNNKPNLAWGLYLKMETSSESFLILQMIANDCYSMKQYMYAAKAFDVLERLDPSPEYWEGKRGACMGVFSQILSGEDPKENLRTIVGMLRNTSNPQVEYIIRVIVKYAKSSNTRNKYIKNYSFPQLYQGQECNMTMTALVGHLMELDFSREFHNWKSVPFIQLFDANVIKKIKDDMKSVADNLKSVGRRSQMLIIWTDNDLEGENIGSEVADLIKQVNPRIIVKRARFSVVQDREIRRAWNVLYDLDLKQAAAVDARSELDLRIGSVFTRFQTLRLKDKFPQLQDSKCISYGSCQFPTLGFVVDRYQKVKDFRPENFWKIELSLEKDTSLANFTWSRGHLFDQHAVFALYEVCVNNPTCTVTNVVSKPTSKWAPLPLTTIEMQKIGSRSLKMTSDKIMTIAEKLYNQGIISYPRTETDSFDEKFELRPLIEAQARDNRWGTYAQGLLDGKFKFPRKGKNNDKAHSPIHPCRAADNLEGDEKRLYEFITRRFLACCSDAAKGHSTNVTIQLSSEIFTANGLMVLERNYLEVYPFEKWSDSFIPNFQIGETFQPTRLEMTSGSTTKPNMLTEADLISLMDSNGIGTDATIHEHIKKIIEREYVNKEGVYFYPTTLGMALVKGYDEMDMNLSLSKPFLRSQMESNMKLICQGARQREEVVRDTVEMYREAFVSAFSQVHILEENCAKYLGDEHNDENQSNRQNFPTSAPQISRYERRNEIQNVAINVSGQSDQAVNSRNSSPSCMCGIESISRSVKKEGENCGRQFYACSKLQTDESRCNFFQWMDEPGSSRVERIPVNRALNDNIPAALCNCGNACVERTVKKDGPNLGRVFLTCSKPQDDDTKCDMFKWKDECEQTSIKKFEENSMQRSNSKQKCNCDLVAVLKTCGKSGENHGRQFFTCPKTTAKCQFFKWDEISPQGSSNGNDCSNSKLKCFNCGETGHFSNACKTGKSKNGNRRGKAKLSLYNENH